MYRSSAIRILKNDLVIWISVWTQALSNPRIYHGVKDSFLTRPASGSRHMVADCLDAINFALAVFWI